MTIGLFGHSKLTDLAKAAIDRNDGKENAYRVYVTKSFSTDDREILNEKNLEDIAYFFIGSIGYKSIYLKENVFKSILNIAQSKGYPSLLECIDHHSITPRPGDWRRGLGNWIMEGATIQSFTSLGNGNTIWSGSTVSHHASMDNFNWLSPGATICGEVKLGSNNFIGANAVITSGVSIQSYNLICTGAIVSKPMGYGQIALPGLNRIIKPPSIEKEWSKLK